MHENLTVTVIDDHVNKYSWYRQLFANFDDHYQLSLTNSSQLKVEKKLPKTVSDIIVVDYNALSSHVIAYCRRLKSQYKSFVGIIVLVTCKQLKNMSLPYPIEIDDFCVQENIETELLIRIVALGRVNNIINSLLLKNRKLRRSNSILEQKTIMDELSGLYNMAYFKRRLKQEFIRSQRYNKHLSVMMLDLDRFKHVNDFSDHLMGSFVLTAVGKIIAASIRSDDIAARFGGDEFVVMLPETNRKGAWVLAERLRTKICNHTYCSHTYKVKVTASIGLANLEPSSTAYTDSSELLRTADLQLYRAKSLGKNCVLPSNNQTVD